MRTVAIILNLSLLGFTVFLVLQEGFALEQPWILFFVLIILAPLVNLVALFLQGPSNKDWMARYLARKAREKRQKSGAPEEDFTNLGQDHHPRFDLDSLTLNGSPLPDWAKSEFQRNPHVQDVLGVLGKNALLSHLRGIEVRGGELVFVSVNSM